VRRFLFLSWLNNVKLTVSYKGTRFNGFQIQPIGRTVAGCLTKAFEKTLGKSIRVVASGRTDSGVHALGQVINVRVPKSIPLDGLVAGVSSQLPDDIRIFDPVIMDSEFSSRRSAVSREYCYLFSAFKMPFYLAEVVTQIDFVPDDALLPVFRDILLGQHDFVRFRNTGSIVKSTVREILDFEIVKKNRLQMHGNGNSIAFYELKIVANAFLYKMVRNLVGGIFEVLQGRTSPEEFQRYLYGDDISYYYRTAPASGLCLTQVRY
jgi:tRNA pseudouridine38-40 synthase